MVYQPSEDSHLLASVLKSYVTPDTKVLDMGTGSGIQARTCKDLGATSVTAADIDPEVIKTVKDLKVIQSDLFSNISEKYDLILFNPPYLPEDPDEAGIDTTAGKTGNEIIIRFIKEAKNYLNKNGKILLLISSLSKPLVIEEESRKLGLKIEEIANEKLFFEKLFVLLITP